MTSDIARLIAYYQTPLGRISRALVHEQIVELAGDVTGKRILGLGFATPYLRFTLERAERVLAFMPARQGASAWPRQGPSHSVLCDPLEMPLTDAAIDLSILVHALEHVSDDEDLMRELWRITAPNGHLLLVVPRRRGIWAQRDNTPFGQGNPYSGGQLENLLKDNGFVPEIWGDGLFLPPVQSGLVLRSTRFFERLGRFFGPAMSGVVCVRARKKASPAIPRRRRAERYVKLPDLSPATARLA